MIVLFVFCVDTFSAAATVAEFLDFVLFLPKEKFVLGPGNINSLPWKTPGILF